MEYSEKIFEKKFSDKVSKNAYLKACKWLATHVYNKVELVDFIRVKIKKENEDENQFPTFAVTLYATIDGKEIDERFCKKCKQMYSIFYSVDKPKCEECKKHAYCLELNRQLGSIKNFLEGIDD